MTDQEAFDQLQDSLWYLLRCRCQNCSDELDLSEYDKVKDRDAMAWSRVAAERAFEQGWRSSEKEPLVYCARCADGQRNGHRRAESED